MQDDVAGLLRLISSLQNEVTPDSKKGWYYKDDAGEVQGPYPPAWMNKWCQQGYFDDDAEVSPHPSVHYFITQLLFPALLGRLQVRFGEDGAMFKLSQMFPDPSSAFLINCMADSSGVKEACEKV